jgi:hypothetical protein
LHQRRGGGWNLRWLGWIGGASAATYELSMEGARPLAVVTGASMGIGIVRAKLANSDILFAEQQRKMAEADQARARAKTGAHFQMEAARPC